MQEKDREVCHVSFPRVNKAARQEEKAYVFDWYGDPIVTGVFHRPSGDTRDCSTIECKFPIGCPMGSSFVMGDSFVHRDLARWN